MAGDGESRKPELRSPLSGSSPVRRPRTILPWIVGIAFALAVLFVILWAAGVFTQKSVVPDVVGKTVTSAEASISDAGFKLGAVSHQATAGKPQGTVLLQTPVAGAEAEHGSSVNLVAVGTSLKTVPNVVGMSQSAAKTAITDAGLTLGSVALVYSATAPAETVIDQAPPAGVEASAGSHVAISVSRGPAPAATPAATAVPNVIGRSQSEAVATLQAAGFAVVVYQVSSTTVPAGTVSAQSPTGGALAEPGTTVTIVVSTGASTSSPAP
jgi:eukaryotic-like serine/threonine-protein kinase